MGTNSINKRSSVYTLFCIVVAAGVLAAGGCGDQGTKTGSDLAIATGDIVRYHGIDNAQNENKPAGKTGYATVLSVFRSGEKPAYVVRLDGSNAEVTCFQGKGSGECEKK